MSSDVFSKAKRSEVMSKIRSHGNKATELALMKLFRLHHITGWRRHQKVFGKPDFLFRRNRLAIFVDGCFWHGCPRCYRRPKSNRKFWDAKITRNQKRDRRVKLVLRNEGWQVLRFWEHDLKANGERAAYRITKSLGNAHPRLQSPCG